MRDQDLRYLIRVADAELREATKIVSTLNKEMARSEQVGARSGAGYARSWKDAEVVAGRSLKSIAKTGAAIGAGFFTADKVLDELNEAVGEASKLNAAAKTVESTFDSSADSVLRWAQRIDDSLAIAEREALAGAAGFGALFASVDVGTDKSAEMSRVLVELAGDLAAVKDQDVSDVLQRLTTGLIGRTSGLRQYEIFLNKATIEQAAMAMTGKENADALTDQEKILARYQLILEQTLSVQGKATELSGEHAQRTRQLDAEIKNAQATIGNLLVPALNEGKEAAIDFFQAIGAMGDIAVRVKIHIDEGLPEAAEGPAGRAANFWKDWILGGVGRTGLKAAGEAGERIGGLISDEAEKGMRELDISDRIKISRQAAAREAAAAAAEIEKALATRLGNALEDVHEKALNVFDRETDALVSAHDRVTDNLLDRFDETTRQMVEGLSVVVKVGERQFEIGQGQLTPAERELEALEKIEQKRNLRRESFDARTALSQAELIGAPEEIREAQRRVQDVETERKRTKLRARAETEREAADKALEEEERQLRASRDAQREDIQERRRMQRNHLADRRRALRENLDAELKEIKTALEKQKRAASDAQLQIIATLRKYGADYKNVGEELGSFLLEGFMKGLRPDKKSPFHGLPGTYDPKTGKITGAPVLPRKGAARGGIAGRLGPAGPTDTIPAWLTRGEMILTDDDQERLARLLGVPVKGAGLLQSIRMGFADGGIADQGLFEELLARFSSMLSKNAVAIGTGLADPRMLAGGLSDAERQLLSPIHIQSKVRDGLTAAESRLLGRDGRLKLMGELAQRQAHPARAGLVRTLPTGLAAGSHFRDPFGGGSNVNFGDVTAHFPNARTGYEAFEEVRRWGLRHARRNVRRQRGRNRGKTVGLG